MPRGGRRPGSGRPKKGQERRTVTPAQAVEILAAAGPDTAPAPAAGDVDAKQFLEQVMAGHKIATLMQMDAARSLLPFQHKKLGETGKKEQRKEDAGKVSRFSPAPPRMASAHAKRH